VGGSYCPGKKVGNTDKEHYRSRPNAEAWGEGVGGRDLGRDHEKKQTRRSASGSEGTGLKGETSEEETG